VFVASQGERRAQTRRALLDAAASLFAERGVDGASIDAIAEAADRTSGAVYDHFGGKDGLLFALLEGWVDDAAAVIGAEMATASSLEERMASVWRNVSRPVGGNDWLALEHELWSYATRNEEARARLAARYRAAWDGVDAAAAGGWVDGTGRVGPAVIGLLLGLEMMRRLDESAVTDEFAVTALCGVVTALSTGVRT
jgi:AcrR family transcriptional regulator